METLANKPSPRPASEKAPAFEDLTLYDVETGEPFTFTAGEQEFYWRQGFAPPKYAPHRRAQKKLERTGGKPEFKVRCRDCGRKGLVLLEAPDPRVVFCEECFEARWRKHLEEHPDQRAKYEADLAEYEELKVKAKEQKQRFKQVQE